VVGVCVRGGSDVFVVVDFAVMVDLVVEVIAELIEEAGLNESHGGSFDAGFALYSLISTIFGFGYEVRVLYLAAVETDCNHTDLLRVAEEALSDGRWGSHCVC